MGSMLRWDGALPDLYMGCVYINANKNASKNIGKSNVTTFKVVRLSGVSELRSVVLMLGLLREEL